jgi:hypothetical protein
MQNPSMKSAPKPRITLHKQGFTDTQLEVLAGSQREMDDKSHG